ncbi:MAG: glucose-1-phosphate thymidylyltransferase [Planctomycetia bacterium]|nr:glucose-1-phosphate thymidylyltransferase [Planctomycetia bacterium]
MPIVLFEDELTDRLDPIAVAQPAFVIGCGSFRLVDLVAQFKQPMRHLVRPYLRAIQQFDYPDSPGTASSTTEPLLLVNARLVPSDFTRAELARLLRDGRPGVVHHEEHLVAAVVTGRDAATLGTRLTFESVSHEIAKLKLAPLAADLPLMDYPHDVIRYHVATLANNLATRISGGGYREAAPGVFLAPGAELGPYVVTDASGGPIVLEAMAHVGAHSFLAGPIHLGAGARVAEHSAVRQNVALGHTTKLGGEVTDSIIEPYSNKQHHGFIGHSYLGRWVNLGAGTCTSNLKNTYGSINMEYGGRKVATGMQFLGCIIGDFAKAAINTGVFTGKTVGACSMLYGFVTTNVPAFVNYARSFGQTSEVPVEVMIAAQARMFARRKVQQRPCDIELLESIFRLTAPQRAEGGERMSDEPLSL